MELHLTDQEAALLLQLLRNHLGDLRMEIRDTDSYVFREGLKADEMTFRRMIQLLETGTPMMAAAITP